MPRLRRPRTGRRQAERIADVDDDAENGNVAEGDLGPLPSTPTSAACRLSDFDVVERAAAVKSFSSCSLCSRMRSRRASSAGVEPERARLQTCAARFGLEAALFEPCFDPGPTVLPAEPRRQGGFAQECNSPEAAGENSGSAPLAGLRTKRRAQSAASASRAAIFEVLERRGQSGHRRPFVGLRIVTTVSRGWTMASGWLEQASPAPQPSHRNTRADHRCLRRRRSRGPSLAPRVRSAPLPGSSRTWRFVSSRAASMAARRAARRRPWRRAPACACRNRSGRRAPCL